MSSLYTCRSCQRALIDAFSLLSTVSIRQSTRHSTKISSFSRAIAPSQRRHFQSTTTPLRQDAASPTETSHPSPPPTSPAPDPSIPWYLQVPMPTPSPSPTHQTTPISTYDIPPIPADAPSILDPILSHLSITTGLNSLTLLDLRHLDPPAALGSNLLMIIGTARSHKHLNTSADRFCRWLRSTYKLRPYADGLLGRNEMKLKLRRRNKKLKLARTVGNTLVEKEERDDGITTGWICCNLGIVDDDPAELGQGQIGEGVEEVKMELEHVRYSQKDQERILEDEEGEYVNPAEDFVYRGFGSALNAPKIVVQMFTEEKRAEMDLEGLWASRVVRREKKAERADEIAAQFQEADSASYDTQRDAAKPEGTEDQDDPTSAHARVQS